MQDYTKDERRRLAAKSRTEPPMFGSLQRQEVTRAVHQRMLDAEKAPTSKVGYKLLVDRVQASIRWWPVHWVQYFAPGE